jgi:hypothetical protein
MEPKFRPNSELARHVAAGHRLPGNRTAVAAFIDPPSEDPSKDYLSVNSLELATLEEVADYYHAKLQRGTGDVAICTTKVFTFSDAGKKSGIDLQRDNSQAMWFFTGKSGKREAAYRHRPVRSSQDIQCESHCGVEFVRLMDEHAKSKFARRLGGRRYHLIRRRRRRR